MDEVPPWPCSAQSHLVTALEYIRSQFPVSSTGQVKVGCRRRRVPRSWGNSETATKDQHLTPHAVAPRQGGR